MRHDYHVVYTTIEDGWIMATVPELPGAVTQGRDMGEARDNIREAVELLLQSYRENAAKDVPAARSGRRFRWKSPRHETCGLDPTSCAPWVLPRSRRGQSRDLPQPGQRSLRRSPETP